MAGLENFRIPRSAHKRVVAGVLGGIAQRFDLNVWPLRLLFLVSLLLPGPQTVLYLIAWVIMPAPRSDNGVIDV
ncbi:MAG: PspC domain-containing protein [Bowdeniella nasicola]|nr:PspC domain-containing protein [Bowdeniella nasicola]